MSATMVAPGASRSAPRPWLFSARVDVAVFGGSAALAFLLLGVGARLGVLRGETPEWAWVPAVLLVDVAHVYATAFRVYLDPGELRRRPALYALVPVAGYVGGVTVWSMGGERVFWRVLAYVAVFHFVRQQRGWVKLYRARAGERDRLTAVVDAAAIYLATLYPLVWWHAHLPRAFWWFLEGDFAVAVPGVVATAFGAAWALALVAYAATSARAWWRGRGNPGKDLVVATTALTWFTGIVALNSDYAFTVTNVLVHGIPYLALVWAYVRQRAGEGERTAARLAARGVWVMLASLWVAAYLEELLWDRAVWHERAWLFGGAWNAETWKVWIVPALALPQLVHYVLDGFVWRRRRNAVVDRVLHIAPE
ncbi:MAG TPA: hypothetical protein VMV18_14215 [bacterium]|nr:hypothetical protein [bacterium]